MGCSRASSTLTIDRRRRDADARVTRARRAEGNAEGWMTNQFGEAGVTGLGLGVVLWITYDLTVVAGVPYIIRFIAFTGCVYLVMRWLRTWR